MGPDSHRPRGRLAGFLERQYRGEHKTKRLAADIGCTPKAAENILSGHWPNDLHMAAIVRRFGGDIWQAVFAPEIEPVLARLALERRELEEALERARARERQVGGGQAGRPEPVAADERSFSPEG